MLGFRLTEFITTLRASGSLAEYDQNFLKNFDAQFVSLKPYDILNPTQLEWLQDAFSVRWMSIVDTNDDYTFNPGGNNQCWIKLAQDLVSELGKTYLQILIPTATNAVDVNSLLKHTDVDLRFLYLGVDGLLYSIPGLLKVFKDTSFLSTFKISTDKEKEDKDKDGGVFKPRALTVRELMRIRSKAGSEAGDLSCELFGEKFENPWECIKRIMPGWKIRGDIPKHMLSPLLQLIKIYYTSREKETSHVIFLEKLAQWERFLHGCTVDEVNRLYSQTIRVGDKDVLLVEILGNWIKSEPSSDLSSQILGVARWLCTYDGSLIADRTELAELYTELKVGPAFNIEDLKLFLPQLLPKDSTSELTKAIVALLKQLETKATIDDDLVQALRKIYRTRWTQIQDKEADYFRLQGGINAPWIRLAQLLSGAGHIEANYYRMLIPTLVAEADIDPVMMTSVTEYPLSEMILSANGKELILVSNCAAHYREHETFNNCNDTPARPLTPLEKRRFLQIPSNKFDKYKLIVARPDAEEPTVSRDTILAVCELVDNSVYVSLDGIYTKEQMVAADNAYTRFQIYLHTLPAEEMERLLAQRIHYSGKIITVRRVLEAVARKQCIASCGRLLAQLVMDFMPWQEFCERIEKSVDIDVMRVDSRRKVFSGTIDNNEAARRILIIATSLMTQDFTYSIMGELVYLWDSSNIMASETKAIYELIKPMIESGDFKDARFIYLMIMESIVAPALAAVKSSTMSAWMTWAARSTVTQSWLESIADKTLFTQTHAWVKPELLMTKLLMFRARDPATHRSINVFLAELVRTYAQPQNVVLKSLRVNILFRQLLNTLDPIVCKQVLAAVDAPITPIDNKSFYTTYATFLIRHLANLGAIVTKHQLGFFSPEAVFDEGKFRRIRELLSSAVRAEDCPGPELVIARLGARITRIANRTCPEEQKARMGGYLQFLLSPITSSVSSIVTTSLAGEGIGLRRA